jgi:hypothetical protein
MYGSNIDPIGRMSTLWFMMGGGYVPGYHTHTIIIAPSIVGTPMIFVAKGTPICHSSEKVSVFVLVMPLRMNSIEGRRLLTSFLLKPSLELVLVGMKPSMERP